MVIVLARVIERIFLRSYLDEGFVHHGLVIPVVLGILGNPAGADEDLDLLRLEQECDQTEF